MLSTHHFILSRNTLPRFSEEIMRWRQTASIFRDDGIDRILNYLTLLWNFVFRVKWKSIHFQIWSLVHQIHFTFTPFGILFNKLQMDQTGGKQFWFRLVLVVGWLLLLVHVRLAVLDVKAHKSLTFPVRQVLWCIGIRHVKSIPSVNSENGKVT